MNVVSLTLNAQGAGDTYEEANANAVARLAESARKIKQGKRPLDPGVTLDDRDPGGGGGPCEPQKYSVDIIVDPTILPEFRPRDD